MRNLILLFAILVSTLASGQSQSSPDVAPFISLHAPTFVLAHVRVIDGTGESGKRRSERGHRRRA